MRAWPASASRARPCSVTLLTAMFVHGGWLHLLSTCCSCGLRQQRRGPHGRPRSWSSTSSAGWRPRSRSSRRHPFDVPMIGASGAIAGVLGGYLVLYPARPGPDGGPAAPRRLPLRGPRRAVLLIWFLLQVLDGSAALVGAAQRRRRVLRPHRRLRRRLPLVLPFPWPRPARRRPGAAGLGALSLGSEGEAPRPRAARSARTSPFSGSRRPPCERFLDVEDPRDEVAGHAVGRTALLEESQTLRAPAGAARRPPRRRRGSSASPCSAARSSRLSMCSERLKASTPIPHRGRRRRPRGGAPSGAPPAPAAILPRGGARRRRCGGPPRRGASPAPAARGLGELPRTAADPSRATRGSRARRGARSASRRGRARGARVGRGAATSRSWSTTSSTLTGSGRRAARSPSSCQPEPGRPWRCTAGRPSGVPVPLVLVGPGRFADEEVAAADRTARSMLACGSPRGSDDNRFAASSSTEPAPKAPRGRYPGRGIAGLVRPA